MSYQSLFETLWQDYTKRNPHALKIHKLFSAQGEKIVNDHIAFRTFNHPKINVEHLASFFKNLGYVEKGQYDFSVKKLSAKHYEHEDPLAPKVFISELLTEKFSPLLQATIQACIDKIPNTTLQKQEILWSGTFWGPLKHTTYQELLAESEYAAWMYAFGFCANHFTVNVNEFKNFTEVKDVNDFLLQNGFLLNTSGGMVKGTPADCLEQSSTLAEEIDVEFSEGIFKIPSCYYEFAKRYPKQDGKLYTGFIAASADKIFESTDRKIRED